MSKLYTSGSAAIPIILIMSTSLSVIAISTVFLAENNNNVSQKNLDEILNDVVTEVTTYLQIPDAVGKYQEINGTQKIDRIALMIKPISICNIDLSDLTIKLENNENIRILNYNGAASRIHLYSLFEHPLWKNISDGTFGCIIIHDVDDSISQRNIINDHTDMLYLAIPLPNEMAMKYKDTLRISIIPPSGIIKTVYLEVPFSMKHIIDFIWD